MIYCLPVHICVVVVSPWTSQHWIKLPAGTFCWMSTNIFVWKLFSAKRFPDESYQPLWWKGIVHQEPNVFAFVIGRENSRQLATLPLRRNSILMTLHYPDLRSASDWSCRMGNLVYPIRSTAQILVVTRHQYGISALVSQTSFGGETSDSVAKCRLFSHAIFRIKQCQTWRRLWTTAWGALNHSCGNSILLRNFIYEGNHLNL